MKTMTQQHIYKSMTMKNTLSLTSLLVAGAVALPGLAQAQNSDETGWYVSGSGQYEYSVWGSGPNVTFSNGVSKQGRTDYTIGEGLSLAVGKEMRKQNDDGSFRQWRLEGEYWQGNIERKRIRLGALEGEVNDSIKSYALFVNALTRFHQTENTRWWAGAGLGYGHVSYGDMSSALGGVNCNCLGAATGSGLALRAKLQAEAYISQNTTFFYEFGYARLPGADRGGLPSTSYGHVSFTHGSLGIRRRF